MTDRRLLVIDQAPADAGACCGACAASATAEPEGEAEAARSSGAAARPLPSPLPVVTRRPIARDLDRRITVAGVLVAIGFVMAAVVTGVVGGARGGLTWLPLHLALAGGAGTAVASVLPFFTSALAVAAPANPGARAAAIGLVASGAGIVGGSVASGEAFLGHIGGSVYLAGIAGVALVAFLPLRGALGPRRRRVELAYAVALLQVGISVAIATAFLAGWTPVLERWAALKPAHAWLNLVGFVSLIIVATLIHLAPTVEGTRIRPRRSATVALAGIGLGVPLIALGYGSAADDVARVGAVVVLIGALGVPIHALAVGRDHGRWTTDFGWHRLTTHSLRAASVWFAVAILVAAGRVVWMGSDPTGWSIGLVAAPLAVGWVLQVLIASWSHLLPAIGPGDQRAHAVQRRILGQLSRTRLIAMNAGVALLWVGSAVGVPIVATIGGVGVVAALAGAVVLAGSAAWSGIRSGPTVAALVPGPR